MGAVAILRTVIAVVKAENVAMRAAGGGGMFADFAGAAGDRLHSADQPLGIGSAPVAGEKGPHHGTEMQFARHAAHPGIAETEWRAKPLGRRSQDLRQGGLAQPQLGENMRPVLPEQIRMRFGVIADGVAAGGDLAHEARAFAGECANEEECCVRVVAIEKVEKF